MHWRRSLILTGLLLLVGLPVRAQTDWTGAWRGTFGVPASALRAGAADGAGPLEVVLRVHRSGDGWSGVLDVPAYGLFGAEARIRARGDTLAFEVAGLGAAFTGVRSPDTRRRVLGRTPGQGAIGPRISGAWRQGGGFAGLTLVRSAEDPTLRRPQEPVGPRPYAEQDVAFAGGDGSVLRGTLALPHGRATAAVVLVSGSGPHDRDASTAGHRPFLVLADHLVRRGIAVLRYDERGVARSDGDFAAATSEDFAADARAALDFLAGLPGIDPSRVGFIGHSEGGVVAPLAALSGDASFLVLLAAPGLPLADVSVQQSEAILRAEGRPEHEVEASARTARRLMDLVAAGRDAAEVESGARTILHDALAPLGLPRHVHEQQLALGLERFTSPWMQFAARHDPGTVLRQLHAPHVLALHGTSDTQVLPQPNLQRIAAALAEAGNTRVTTRELPGLNHLFQTARTGAPSEYGLLEETFAPAALAAISDWILALR